LLLLLQLQPPLLLLLQPLLLQLLLDTKSTTDNHPAHLQMLWHGSFTTKRHQSR
jgi:hypothetical protein